MARRVRTRLPARHIPRSFSQQHIILRALHRGHINQAITSHRSHLQFPPIRRSRRSRSLHGAPPVRSLHGAPPVRSLHGAPRVRSLHRAPRARSLHRAPPVHSLRSHLQLPSLQARSRPLSASRAAPIRSPHHHLQVMELERHGYSTMLELGPSASYLWSQETSLLETKAMEVDEEVRTLKEELEAIQQEHAELRQKQRELVAQLSVLLETIRAIKSQASEATKCDDICFQPNPSLRSHLQVMGPERRGNVHMLELSVSPSEVLSQPTSFVEIIQKFSEQIEEVRTLKEKAQAVRLSNAKLRQKHVELESLAKAIQSQLLKEYICHDTCSPPSHTKQPIENSTDQEGLHMQQIGSSSSSQIVPQNQVADISHDAGTPAI